MPLSLESQSLARKNCLHPTIVQLDRSGNTILSESGQLELDKDGQTLVSYYGKNTSSKWYEFIASYDFTLSFKIWSDNPQSRYGFFLYRKEGSLFFCEDLSRGIEEPLEAVIYKQEIGILGIGVLPTINEELTDTLKYSKSNLLYDIPFKNAVEVKKGDTLYLNVYRLFAEDCEHFLWLSAGEQTTKIRCTNEQCGYIEPMQIIETKQFFDSTEYFLDEYIRKMNQPEPYIVQLEVIDEDSGEPIQAQLYSGIDKTYSKVLDKTDWAGKKTFTFVYDTTYLIHQVGFHPRAVSFTRDGPGMVTVKLKRLTPGEQFILEHIYFKTNSSTMLTSSRSEIRKLAKFLQRFPDYDIEIQGHTNGSAKIKKDRINKNDFHGNEKKLSRLRAQAVKREITEFGIPRRRIKTKGFGGERMLYPFPKNVIEHDRNKRVEIVIL